MENYLITAIILCFYLRTVLTEPDLQQQNAAQDDLSPLNDPENTDTSAKDQDKRTVFNSNNYGWAKHVGIKPSGHKYVLGYTPVDLKYTPVIRPLSVKHPGYVYGKPSVHFHLRRPTLQLRPARPISAIGWKPVSAVRPVVHVSTAPHHHHLVTKPVGVAHVDHVHLKPTLQVPHVDHVHQVQVPHHDHVHNVPVHVDHVHQAPVHPVPAVPVAQVHPVPVPPPAAVPVALPQPVAPVFPAPQFISSPLFEVTRPNLGVLPFGATFASPILRDVPHHHLVPFQPAVAHQPAFIPQPAPALVHHHQHLIPQPALVPQPVAPVPQAVPVPRPAVVPAPQPAYPPGTVVEYHGTTSFLNQIPLPQVPVNTVQPAPPPHVHFQFPQIAQQLPPHPSPVLPHEQHDVQTPVIPNHPHPHFIQQPVNQNQFHQQLPLDNPSHFQPVDQVGPNTIFQQQLPANVQHSQFQNDQNNQQFIQQTVSQDSGPRYQPADQVSNQQFFQGSINQQQGNFEQLDNQDGGYVYQQPDVPFGQQSVQPGETDLQLPLQLPQHPGFLQNAREFQQNGFQDSSQLQSVFRPSIQLEPPYKK